jgi:hypothetical protein
MEDRLRLRSQGTPSMTALVFLVLVAGSAVACGEGSRVTIPGASQTTAHVVSSAPEVASSDVVGSIPVVVTSAAEHQYGSFQQYVDAELAGRLPPVSSQDAAARSVSFKLVTPAELGPAQRSYALSSPYGNVVLVWATSRFGPCALTINDQFSHGQHPEVGNVALQRQNYLNFVTQANSSGGLHGHVAEIELPRSGLPAILLTSDYAQGIDFLAGDLLVTAQTASSVDPAAWQSFVDGYATQLLSGAA